MKIEINKQELDAIANIIVRLYGLELLNEEEKRTRLKRWFR